MWICKKCGEEIEDTFDKCWNCGTSEEGVEDPTFQKEAPPEGKWRPLASGLVWALRVLGILFGMLGIYLSATIELRGALDSRGIILLLWFASASMMLGMSEAIRLLLQIEQNTRPKQQSGSP